MLRWDSPVAGRPANLLSSLLREPGTDVGLSRIRIARATDDIAALLPFYRDGLGLGVLCTFMDHAGFDGVILGAPGASCHFEFTHQRGKRVGRAPTAENLLVFYIPAELEWRTRVDAMVGSGYGPVPSSNPFWDRLGRTFEDPDGYRVVLQQAAWD